MKLANFEYKGQVRAGVVIDESKVMELKNSEGIAFASTDDILSIPGALERIAHSSLSKGDGAIPLESVKLHSPVLRPEKIYCAAVNYVSHGKEQNEKPPSEPYFFTKFRNALIGPEDPIIIPKISQKADWEVELAVIIGKKGKNIQKKDAMNYVAGYAISNDVSFRDQQFPAGWPTKLNSLGQNWVKGKGLDSAFPLGPWLVTADELSNPYDSEISLSVNGIERQKSKIEEMVFKVDDLVEYAARGVTLVPGDIISTGTPLGVAAFTGVPYLKNGDVVEAKIQKIGTLRNPVRSES